MRSSILGVIGADQLPASGAGRPLADAAAELRAMGCFCRLGMAAGEPSWRSTALVKSGVERGPVSGFHRAGSASHIGAFELLKVRLLQHQRHTGWNRPRVFRATAASVLPAPFFCLARFFLRSKPAGVSNAARASLVWVRPRLNSTAAASRAPASSWRERPGQFLRSGVDQIGLCRCESGALTCGPAPVFFFPRQLQLIEQLRQGFPSLLPLAASSARQPPVGGAHSMGSSGRPASIGTLRKVSPLATNSAEALGARNRNCAQASTPARAWHWPIAQVIGQQGVLPPPPRFQAWRSRISRRTWRFAGFLGCWALSSQGAGREHPNRGAWPRVGRCLLQQISGFPELVGDRGC